MISKANGAKLFKPKPIREIASIGNFDQPVYIWCVSSNKSKLKINYLIIQAIEKCYFTFRKRNQKKQNSP